MSFGRLHCFLVATKNGEVIYERFYDRLNEAEKAEIRSSFQLASSNVRLTLDEVDYSAAYKTGRFSFIPCGDLVFYLLGTGEYDELACAEALRSIIGVLRDVTGKTPSSSLLLDKYARLCLVVDEVINEGLLETLDKDTIRKAIKNKAAWE
mmetsp:Transcript_11180/g.24075  ORF Transcript_11180/g.24075 Transcript_11180/m.24075 type:complete len:151 (-) Transcript_11180:781-1233(-)|eukprot:CAMPEP_0202896372 /NCGR_PEP_ID=MMETSP1392-20130828/5395_1 /ASSEMBLY_ACC=CAM_ASM_000868 /TAXON_ID=225041 /ORGANISM="Chlamydomonas chlamydogama, Strain SAG 11-48b" /LENGTH=150 /DNA_ID=CAMNT_0049581715 /DNA_START=57 /DNA_END=509 /DNA_ORIENTATION=-